MITRIVRLNLQEEKVTEFQSLFTKTYEAIRSFKGCRHLALYRDTGFSHVFITLSKWDTEQDLENYRNSTLFKETWQIVKAMFQDAPIAFSMQEDFPLNAAQTTPIS